MNADTFEALMDLQAARALVAGAARRLLADLHNTDAVHELEALTRAERQASDAFEALARREISTF